MKYRKICKQASEFCEKNGVDLSKLVIQYAVQNEMIPTTLVSTASLDNIQMNIKWTEEQMDEDLLTGVLTIPEPIHNQTWPSGNPEFAGKII
jgi:L-galactose dehydrogenase